MYPKKDTTIMASVPIQAERIRRSGPGELMGELMAAIAPFIATYGSRKPPLVQQDGGENPCR